MVCLARQEFERGLDQIAMARQLKRDGDMYDLEAELLVSEIDLLMGASRTVEADKKLIEAVEILRLRAEAVTDTPEELALFYASSVAHRRLSAS